MSQSTKEIHDQYPFADAMEVLNEHLCQGWLEGATLRVHGILWRREPERT
jgi:phosphoketolase